MILKGFAGGEYVSAGKVIVTLLNDNYIFEAEVFIVDDDYCAKRANVRSLKEAIAGCRL